MGVDPPLRHMVIQKLSGGNQQKVVVGRWLAVDPAVLIFDEPTHGIDVGTKTQVYRLLNDLATAGKAIILISSELIELAELADRILVVRDGRLVRELTERPFDGESLFVECME